MTSRQETERVYNPRAHTGPANLASYPAGIHMDITGVRKGIWPKFFQCTTSLHVGLSAPPQWGRKGTVKFIILHYESIGRCSSPYPMPWAHRWRTTNVCDVWPVWRQTYGYLPSRKASPPIGWYQIILLSDRGSCVITTCPGLHSTVGRPGFRPITMRETMYVKRPQLRGFQYHRWQTQDQDDSRTVVDLGQILTVNRS